MILSSQSKLKNTVTCQPHVSIGQFTRRGPSMSTEGTFGKYRQCKLPKVHIQIKYTYQHYLRQSNREDVNEGAAFPIMRHPISTISVALLAATPWVLGCLQISCQVNNACADDIGPPLRDACSVLQKIRVPNPLVTAYGGQLSEGQTSDPLGSSQLIGDDGCSQSGKHEPTLQLKNSPLAVEHCEGNTGVLAIGEVTIWRGFDNGNTVQTLRNGVNKNSMSLSPEFNGTVGPCTVTQRVDCKTGPGFP